MTKTYNDIGAVTRLLEEKERDLELAAKIGQTLLEKNKSSEDKNETLEDLLSQANERINQLKYELTKKDELLKFYTQNLDGPDSSPDGCPSDVTPQLQNKIKSLEEANLVLHLETTQLKSATNDLEEKEQQLVGDCVRQLEETHQQLALFSKELSEKSEECSTQKEAVTNLLSQIVALQKRIKTLTVENLDLQNTLEASHDSQRYLVREVADLKEKNEEILILLEETQEEIRRLRNKERPSVTRHRYMSTSLLSVPSDSLASELECSLKSELDFPQGFSPMERRKHSWKVFETAKAAKKAKTQDRSFSSLTTPSVGDSNRSSTYLSDESGISDGGDMESLYGANHKLGRPGVPGSSDLHTALRRLSMRRANELNEMDYRADERERQRRQRCTSDAADQGEVEHRTPQRCHSPESVTSGVSGYMSMTSNNQHYRMPEKLQIVKPLEGSVTLRHWQQLATPHLGGIFESRPGVQIKGEREIDLEPEVYTLSDYEEDDDVLPCPTKFEESPPVYTYTNSTVKHPSEAERTGSTRTSSTPKMATSFKKDDRMGTSTFSMSMGLAAILNERDLMKTPPEGEFKAMPIGANPERFPSLVSDKHFMPAHTIGAATCTTYTATSFSAISSPSAWSPQQQSSSHGNTGSYTTSPNLTETVIDKLKNTGFNLYGYLAGGNTSRPDSLPVTKATTTATTPVLPGTTGETNVDKLVVAGSLTRSECENKSKLASLLTPNAAGGIVGALASWRSGIL